MKEEMEHRTNQNAHVCCLFGHAPSFELRYDWLPSRCHDEWVHLRFCVRREVVTARMGGVDLHSALASELPSSQC